MTSPVVESRPSRRFVRALVAISLGALALRWAWILIALRDAPLGKGDAYYYVRGAQLLVDGHGFIQPHRFDEFGDVAQAASHPPGYLLFLAGLIVLGIKGMLGQMLASAVLGAATVAACGLAARRIAGDAVGLVAAGIAALYANLWASDGMLLSETLAMLAAALIVIAAYRLADRRSPLNAGILGLAIGAGAMARSELIFVALAAAVPLCLARAAGAWSRRLVLLGVCGAVCLAAIAPWVIYNQGRFTRPVYLSAGLEITMAVSNCDPTYDVHSGNFAYWDYSCQFPIDRAAAARGLDTTEESERSAYMATAVKDYVRRHESKVPLVLAARIGRITGLYRVDAQRVADASIEGRPVSVATTASVQYLLLAPAALGGALVLRRRRRELYPLLALVATVIVSTLLTWPNTRYRAPAEPAIVILAAVAVVAIAQRVRRRERESVATDAVEAVSDAGLAGAEPVSDAATVTGDASGADGTPSAGGLDHLRALDGVRAIAAAGVLVSHVAIGSGFVNADRWASLPTVLHPLRSLLARGDVGVAIFFMLSGFLMYRPIAAALHRGTALPDWRRYTVRRIARIFPLYWLVTTVAIVVQTTGVFGGTRTPFPPALDLLRYYTLTHIYWFRTVIGPVGPSWSLATEISFYLFLPLFATASWRWLRRDGRVSVTAQIGSLAVMIAASFAFKGLVVLWTDEVRTGALVANDARGLLRSWLPSNLDVFGIGMVMAVLWVSRRAPLDAGAEPDVEPGPEPSADTEAAPASEGSVGAAVARRRWVDGWATVPWSMQPWMAAASWTAAAVAYWWCSHSLGLPDFQANYSSGQELTRHLGYAAVAGFVLAPACFGPADRGLVRRLLRSRPLVWGGLISYGVYLWHQVVSDVWFRITGHEVFRSPVAVELFWIVLVSVVLSSATYVLYERPVLRRVTRRFSRSPR